MNRCEGIELLHCKGSELERPGFPTRVLVPVDLSPSSVKLLQFARNYGVRFDSMLQLLHVVRLNVVGEECGIPRSSLIRELSDEARLQLRALLDVIWRGEFPASIVVRHGRPAKVIIQEARDTNAHLIIMGGRERGPLARLFWPGILTRVLRKAPCPVLAAGGAAEQQSSVDAMGRVASFLLGERRRGSHLSNAFVCGE